MMYSLKRIIALAAAAVSASTLIAAQATAAFASEESDYEEMLRQKQLEAEAFLSEQTDIPEEQPEIKKPADYKGRAAGKCSADCVKFSRILYNVSVHAGH